MKQSLLLLAFIVAVGANGQTFKTDSLPVFTGSYFLSAFDTVIQKPKYDTIKVIMLVSDTSSADIFNGIRYISNNPLAYYIYGYAVYGMQGFVSYLDDRKRPLANKVVWMSKTLQ